MRHYKIFHVFWPTDLLSWYRFFHHRSIAKYSIKPDKTVTVITNPGKFDPSNGLFPLSVATFSMDVIFKQVKYLHLALVATKKDYILLH